MRRLTCGIMCAIWLLGCDESAPPPPITPVTPSETAEPATPKEPVQRDAFLQGTLEQEQLKVKITTQQLRGDDVKLIESLTELFFSEPTSLPQLAAGFHLVDVLERLNERDRARRVLKEFEDATIRSPYDVAVWLKVAYVHDGFDDEQGQADATRMYERVLKARPDYFFVWKYLAEMGSAEALPTYVKKRDELLASLQSPDEQVRWEALELISMLDGEDAVVASALEKLAGEPSQSARIKALAADWIKVHTHNKGKPDE